MFCSCQKCLQNKTGASTNEYIALVSPTYLMYTIEDKLFDLHPLTNKSKFHQSNHVWLNKPATVKKSCFYVFSLAHSPHSNLTFKIQFLTKNVFQNRFRIAQVIELTRSEGLQGSEGGPHNFQQKTCGSLEILKFWTVWFPARTDWCKIHSKFLCKNLIDPSNPHERFGFPTQYFLFRTTLTSSQGHYFSGVVRKTTRKLNSENMLWKSYIHILCVPLHTYYTIKSQKRKMCIMGHNMKTYIPSVCRLRLR